MCTEFVIQVLKQKNARVSCPVGMTHFKFPAIFDVHVFVFEFEFISQEHLSRVCVCNRICYKINDCKKRKVCVSNSKSIVLRIVHVCVCVWFKFVIQVLKQENAHVSFPVGMLVYDRGIRLKTRHDQIVVR